MSKHHPPLFLLAPLAASLLLAACSAASEPGAQGVQSTTPPAAAEAWEAADADVGVDGRDPDPEADTDMDDTDIDPDDFDPAAELRRQLARRPAATGSGGPVQACMLSGRITLMGMSEDVRDCMQSNGKYSVAEFQRACEGLANALVGGGNAPARIDYIARCPSPAQGSCRNFMNTGMDAYYYQRTELASLPGSCSGVGGTWVPAG